MKTYVQFFENIEKRRLELRKRQLEKIETHKQKVADYRARQQEKIQAQQDRENLKKEIKRELQTEQTPVMEPNLYSQQVAKRQAAQKTAHMKHVHSELGAEARAQQSAKRAEIKSIMSRRTSS